MAEALAYLRDLDLSGNARAVWEFLESVDPCFGGLAVVLLVCLGHKIAFGNPKLYGLGLRLGVLTFLLHGAISVIRHGGWNSVPILTQISRSGLAAGAVLAFTWIIFPVLYFLHRYYRVALVAFVLYCGYALVTAVSLDKEILPGIALRGCLAAFLAVILAWIMQPIWDALAPWWRKPPSPVKTEAPPATPEAPPPAPEEAEGESRKSRLERRRWRRLMVMLARPATTIWGGNPVETPLLLSNESRRRRDKARLTAELTYIMAMPDIAHHFPRDMFENWINRYLSDDLPPEDVEENSRHLQMIIARQQKQIQGPGSYLNLEDLHHWFVGEQRRIQSLDLDPADKQAKLLALQELFVSISDRFLNEPGRAVVPMIENKNLGLLVDKESFPELPPQAKAE